MTEEVQPPAKAGIAKVRYTHDAMIDVILANPTVKQTELAEMFDRSNGWVSLIVQSDAFKARLAERKAELVDPLITASVENRLSAVAAKSLELIQEKLEQPLANKMLSEDFVLQTAKMATAALGYGARPQNTGQTTNVAVVVQVPPKAASAQEWANTYSQ